MKVNPEKGGETDEENPDGSFNRICRFRNVAAGVRPRLPLWMQTGSLRLPHTRSNSSKRCLMPKKQPSQHVCRGPSLFHKKIL